MRGKRRNEGVTLVGAVEKEQQEEEKGVNLLGADLLQWRSSRSGSRRRNLPCMKLIFSN